MVKFWKNEKGFTLIEVLIVVAILGILAAIAIPNLTGFLGVADEAAANTEADVVRTAILAYRAEYKGLIPDNVDDVTQYIDKTLVGTYAISNGTLSGVSGWDNLEWENGQWVKVED